MTKNGRNPHLTLYGNVGRGEANFPGDVRAVKSALALTGHVPKASALDPEKSGEFDDETETGIRGFKKAQGLPADGRVELYGRDHDLMSEVTGPKLRALIGEDVRKPEPFREPETRYVGRTMAFRPTTTRAFPVPPENRPDRDDWQIANGIAQTIATEMDELDRYEAEAVSGGEGENSLEDASGEDSPETKEQTEAERNRAWYEKMKKLTEEKNDDWMPDWARDTLDEFTGFAIHRDSETAERDILKMYRHFRDKAIKLLDFGLNTFGPQAYMKAATDGSRQVSEGVVNLDGQAVLDGGVMMAGGLLGIFVPGNYGQYNTAFDQAADAVLAARKEQAEQVLEAPHPKSYDPPSGTKGSFERDYRGRVRSREAGPLQVDMERREITAPVVVGRTEAGGSDRPITPEALDRVAKATTGRSIERRPQSAFDDPYTQGETAFVRSTGEPKRISVLQSLPPDQRRMVAMH